MSYIFWLASCACSTRSELQAQEAAHGFDERLPTATAPFFRKCRPGEGRATLTPAQVERLVAAHREQMARFGYLS
jgi:hypothetical protein